MDDIKASTTARLPLSRRMYALLALGFFAFIVYGSLVPFHYHAQDWSEILVRWDEVRTKPIGIYSFSDWITNVILFMPAGFLAMAVVCVDRPRGLGIVAAPAVLVLCMAFSASVEFTQLFFPPRVSSFSDVAANTLGTSAGIMGWLAIGQPLTGWLRRSWTLLAERGISAQLLPGYLAFLFFVHAIPLDLTIRPSDLYHKYKEGRVRLIPFSGELTKPEALLRKTIWTTTLFLPVGVLLVRLPGSGCAGAIVAARPGGGVPGGRGSGIHEAFRLVALLRERRRPGRRPGRPGRLRAANSPGTIGRSRAVRASSAPHQAYRTRAGSCWPAG